ncbi:MAG: glycosyltransferase family 4 protein [Oligoflexia bacterium]|nr:glycosyltransferase family 4 protein [Oligoflexia bacterium]
MKIAFLAYSALPHIGGAQIFAFNTMNSLVERGHQVHFYLPYKSYKKFINANLNYNFQVRPILICEYFLANNVPILIQLYLFIQQLLHRYDLWQVIGAYPAGYVAKHLSKIVPVILRCHGDDIQKEASINYGLRLNPKLEKKIATTVKKMTKLVALTPTVTDCYIELGATRENIIEIPNGIDLSTFRAFDKQKIKKLLRSKLKIKDNQTLLLTVGRYHIKKGYELIPQIASALSQRNIEFKWLVVGEKCHHIEPLIQNTHVGNSILLLDPTKNEISKLLANFDLTDMKTAKPDTASNGIKIKFSAPSHDLILTYLAHDIFVMPSLLETFGMVLIEAMAAELPVISTDAPGCRDIVIHEHNGLVSKVGDIEKMAHNIEQIIKNENLNNKIRNTIKSEIINYDWSNIAEKYESLYKTTLLV